MVSVKSYKEPNMINIPDDFDDRFYNPYEPLSIYELLLQNDGNFEKVNKILDDKITEINLLIQDLAHHCNDLRPEEFVERITQLKRENRETILLCEEFEKISKRKSQQKDQIQTVTQNRLNSKPPIIPRNGKPNIAILSKKNLTNLHQYGDRLSTQFNNDSDDDFNETEEAILKRERAYQHNSAMSRLYKRSQSAEPRQEIHKTLSDDKWRHHITVPEPFEMTKRDENKRKQLEIKPSRTLIEFQQEKAEKNRKDEEELKKKFRANAVPAHVFIPMYQSMQEDANYRRQVMREYSKEILKSTEKPFNFYKRDEQQRQSKKSEQDYALKDEKVSSNTINSTKMLGSYKSERDKTVIRAKPIRNTSKEKFDMEKLKEEEIYRKVKSEIRAKHLLEESKMPGNMEERYRLQQEKNRQKQLKQQEEEKKLRRLFPTKSKSLQRSVPDFSKIHKDWEEEIRMSSKEPVFTQPKPFKLISDERVKSRSTLTRSNSGTKVQSDVSKTSPHAHSDWSKSILTALEMPRPSTTKATTLREKAVQKQQQIEKLKEYEKQLNKFSKLKKENDVGNKLRQLLDSSNSPKDKQRQKLMELKIEDEQRQEAYRQSMELLKEKVYERPLLFEMKNLKLANTGGNSNNNALNSYSYEQNNNHSRSGMMTGHSRNFSGHADQGHIENSGSGHYSQKFEPYDTKNHFGDHVSYKSTTEASSINSNSNFNNSHTLVNGEVLPDYATSIHTQPIQHSGDYYVDDFEPDVKVNSCTGQELLIEELN